jgi:uncharacterized membrane protein YdjX (TVP38/TMEM64 family)
MMKNCRDFRNRLVILLAGLATILALFAWLAWSEPFVFRWLLRLYTDREFMHQILQRYGVLAPLVFIAIQALQVIIAPIPGDVTGVLGGFAFGQWLGFAYSTIGLTIGSLFAFWLGRRLGASFVTRVTGPDVWRRLDFVVEAEGAILCLIIFLVPGLPKDTLCYLFGVSPIPFWVFAVVSTLGRMPGTWMLSAGGAKAAAAQYAELLLLIAVLAALIIPLYWYRSRIVLWLRRRATS